MINLIKISKKGISKYNRPLNLEICDFKYIPEKTYDQMMNSLSDSHKEIFEKVNNEKPRLRYNPIYEIAFKKDPFYDDNPNELVIDIDKFKFKDYYLRDFWTNPFADHFLFINIISTVLLIYFLLIIKRKWTGYYYGNYEDYDKKIRGFDESYYPSLKKHIQKSYADVFKDINEKNK
jgi:hypothetical protein